jgi:hypothetical protein
MIADRQASQSKPTTLLRQVVQTYLGEKKTKLRHRIYEEVKRHLEKMWKPLHKHSISAITRADIVVASTNWSTTAVRLPPTGKDLTLRTVCFGHRGRLRKGWRE